MKLTRFTNVLVIGLILTVAAVGCRKKPLGVTPLPNGTGLTGKVGDDGRSGLLTENDPTKGVSSSESTSGIPANDPANHQGWNEDANIFKANTVHFAFDSSVVKDSDKGNVTAVADHLKNNAAAAVRIEGHCDERGTAEYNRSLGERRASALREELVGLGIAASRVDTVSYGFERPVAQGHDESAWAQNRRGEFILLTPPAK